MAYNDTVSGDNPTIYYRCEETSGTTLSDDGSAGQTASLSGTYTIDATPLVVDSNSAWEADDDTGQADFSTVLSNQATVSLEVWLRTPSIGLGTRNIMEAGGGGTGLQMQKNSDDQIELVSSGASVTINSSTTLSAGDTKHLVGVYDKSGGSMELYVNATLEDSSSAAAISSNDATGGDDGQFGNPNSGVAGTGTAGLAGIYDEVAGYTLALTATQVQDHFDAGTGAAAGAQTINAPVATATSSTPDPTVTPGEATISPDALTATSSTPEPTLTAGAVTVSPGVLTATTSTPEPSATPGEATITPAAVTAATSTPEPALTPGATTISPGVLDLTTSTPQPNVGLGLDFRAIFDVTGAFDLERSATGTFDIERTTTGVFDFVKNVTGETDV